MPLMVYPKVLVVLVSFHPRFSIKTCTAHHTCWHLYTTRGLHKETSELDTAWPRLLFPSDQVRITK